MGKPKFKHEWRQLYKEQMQHARQMRELQRKLKRKLEEQNRRFEEEEARWSENLRLESEQRMAKLNARVAEVELSLLEEREQDHIHMEEEPSLLSALVDFITGSNTIRLEEKRKTD